MEKGQRNRAKFEILRKDNLRMESKRGNQKMLKTIEGKEKQKDAIGVKIEILQGERKKLLNSRGGGRVRFRLIIYSTPLTFYLRRKRAYHLRFFWPGSRPWRDHGGD
jgi:hypothetical protein